MLASVLSPRRRMFPWSSCTSARELTPVETLSLLTMGWFNSRGRPISGITALRGNVSVDQTDARHAGASVSLLLLWLLLSSAAGPVPEVICTQAQNQRSNHQCQSVFHGPTSREKNSRIIDIAVAVPNRARLRNKSFLFNMLQMPTRRLEKAGRLLAEFNRSWWFSTTDQLETAAPGCRVERSSTRAVRGHECGALLRRTAGSGWPHVLVILSAGFSGRWKSGPSRAALSRPRGSAFRPSGATGAEARLRLPRNAALKRGSSTLQSGSCPTSAKMSPCYSSSSFSGSSPMPIFDSR